MAFYVDIVGRLPQKQKFITYAYKILDHYFGERIKRDVDINITILTKLDNDYVGTCDGDKDSVNIDLGRYKSKGKKKTKLTLEQIAENLAHELIHAKQFIRGEINCDNLKYRYKSGYTKDCSNMSYRETPWEKEAYGDERELFELYWNE